MDRPELGSIQGKVWGTTKLLFRMNGVSCWELHAVKGGYCSLHRHRHRWNRFVVLSGELVVQQHVEDGDGGTNVDESVVQAGGVTDVPPGVMHMFEAKDDSAVLEFYWTELDDGDIERFTTGGRNAC